MTEAMRASRDSGENYASSASYSHFLRSRLLHHEGEHRKALDELRLALVTDEGNPHLLTALAEEYARIGELARAERTLRKVIERAPSHAPGQLLMGRVLAESGKRSRARIHLVRAIRLDPSEPTAYLVLAQVELESRRSDKAVETIEAMALAVPGDARGFRALAAAFAERNDHGRAERMLRRAVEVRPTDAEAWQLLAQVYESTDRLVESESAWANALQRDPDNIELLMNAGRVALRLDTGVRARGWFERALSLTDDPEIAVRIAFAYLSADRTREAVETLEHARRRSTQEPRLSFYAGLIYERLREYLKAAEAYGAVPADSDLHDEAQVRRASALSRGGRHARALEAFKRLDADHPELAVVYPQWARALERAGSAGEAERLLRRAVARRADPEIYDALARNLQRQGKPEEAIALLEEAVRARPEELSLRFALASAYEQVRRPEAGLAHLREVLKRQPDNAAAMNFLGYALAESGRDLAEAERLVKRALELKPDNGAFLDSMGWIYFRKGEVQKAIEYLERAARLEPDEPVIIDHLGDAYRQANRPLDAERTWRRALQALDRADDPFEGPGLRQALEQKLRSFSTGSAER
jgi:tetratricopeptide (TPR) repeat protein